MKRNLLPPLDYLLAFEAAAINQSFAAASRDLNISETAISRKVRLLELHYETQLFVRSHRSIRLTPGGKSLLDKMTPALDMLRETSRELLSEHQGNSVTIAATNSVATLWLMPRLRKFNAANKHLKITLVASDSDQECLADTVDLSILRGDGNWPGYTSKRLFGETVFPVCSPKFLTANPEISTPESLIDHALIEVSNTHTEWMNWKTWLSLNGNTSAGFDGSSSFNTYPLAVQAAVDGLGIALGWGHLVDHLLESGALVRPFGDMDVRTDHGYFLLKHDSKPAFEEQKIVESWLLEVSATRRRYRTRE